jgi:hypothetical protein
MKVLTVWNLFHIMTSKELWSNFHGLRRNTPMNRRIRIIPIRKEKPDLRLLAKALIALVEEQRAQQQPPGKPPKREEDRRAS